MKPTELQKKIIDTCILECNFWKDTNDITSPTHFCSITEEVYQFFYDEELTEYQCSKLNEALSNLYCTIRVITENS